MGDVLLKNTDSNPLYSSFIPLQLKNTIPDEPTIEVTTIPNLTYFGTMASYVVAPHNSYGNKVGTAKKSAI